MNEITGLHHPLLQALGYAVLHSVWQGVLLFSMLKILLAFIPQHRAVWRYRLEYGTLAGLSLLFIYTFISGWQQAAVPVAMEVQQAVPPAQGAGYSGITWQQLLSFFRLSSYGRFVPLLAVVYTLGLSVLCAKMIWELLQVRSLRRAVTLPDAALLDRFDAWKAQAGIRRNVLLRFSDKIQVPVMLGYLKPLVLLPVALTNRLDLQQTESILLHELAHIRRNDYFWNMLQMVLETLLFFNPVVWWLSAAIREEREHCCDDYVLSQTGKTLPYAKALLALEEQRSGSFAAALSAAGNKKTPLLNRIKRFTTMKQHKRSTQRTLAAVTALLLIGGMICFATAFGQGKKDKPVQKTTTKSYSKRVVSVTDDEGHTKTYIKEKGDTAGMAEVMAGVPDAMKMAGMAMKEIDWDEISKTVATATGQAGKAMEAIDWDKIQGDVDKAVKDVDWTQIQSTVTSAMKVAQQSMSKQEWAEINREVAKAMKEVNIDDYMGAARKEMEKAMKEAQEEMKNIDWKEIHESMDEAKIEMAKAKVEMTKAKVEMKKAAQEAQREADQATDTEDTETTVD